ncbi:MAG: hypothetical protein LC768_00365 [Acidobacteria bacterium]|nr:hypothetical protein [Acidobacteriota bacterium]MCA1636791.1 hypothetical protein [Acidobacteriota bacterium]
MLIKTSKFSLLKHVPSAILRQTQNYEMNRSDLKRVFGSLDIRYWGDRSADCNGCNSNCDYCLKFVRIMNYPFQPISSTQRHLIEAYRCGAISLEHFAEAMYMTIIEAEIFLSNCNVKLIEDAVSKDTKKLVETIIEED